MKKRLLTISLLSFVSINYAVAYQQEDDAQLFKERESENYTQKGIKYGSFDILPKMEMTNEYNTNIYLSDKSRGTVDSYVAHFKPGFNVNSNWTRHALNLKFNTDITEYANQADQNNYQDIFTSVDGRLDLLRDSYFNADFSYNSLHEDRGSPDQIAGKGPTFYDNKIINTFYNHKINRISIKTGINSIRYDYQDVATSTSAMLRMSTRSHWEHSPSIRFGYEIQPEYEIFAKFIHKQADYDNLVLSSGSGAAYDRNSTGYNALGGLAFDLTDLITGDISVGYVNRSYSDTRLKDISGINGFVNLKWRPTTLTTITGRISHDINETTQEAVSGIFATIASINLEHEIMRNVLFKIGGNIGNNDYKGHAPTFSKDRNEQLYGGNVSVKYLLNRNLSTDLSYLYQNRDVNYAYTNYEVNQVMLNLRGQF